MGVDLGAVDLAVLRAVTVDLWGGAFARLRGGRPDMILVRLFESLFVCLFVV